MKPPPSSGTSERAWLHAIPGAIGGALGHAAGGTTEAIPGIIAGMAAPGVVGRGLMSKPTQAYLKNQLLSAGVPQGAIDAIVRSALAERAR